MSLYWISTSSCYRVLPPHLKELHHLQPPPPSHFPHHREVSDSWPFPPSTSSRLSSLSRAPRLLHTSLHGAATRWVGAEPSVLQVVGVVAVQRGDHSDSCTPTPLPKLHRAPASMDRGTGTAPLAGNGAFHIPAGDLGVGGPQSPTSVLRYI